MGKAAGGGGGGGGGEFAPGIWQVGYLGDGTASPQSSTVINFTGFRGKYGLISVMHRAEITPPSSCVLLDKTTYSNGGYTQYVSVYKVAIDSDNVDFTFTQSETARISGTAWAVGEDFALVKTDTKEGSYYSPSKIQSTTKALSFVTFSATIAQSGTTVYVHANSDGLWLNSYQSDVKANLTQLRHFSGIAMATKVERSWFVNEIFSGSYTADAQVVVYSIVKA